MNKPLIVLLSLLPLLSVAQDWKLLDESKIYYFSRSDSIGVTNSVRFDSVAHDGDTTIFVLFDNYLEPKDTCISTDEEINQAPENSFFDNFYLEEPLELCDYFEINRGSIIGKEIVELPNGDFVLMPENQLIKTKAGLNDIWIFDPLEEDTATVISIELASYVDTIDSLKTIYLSSGDTIVISKNFGLIQFPVGNGAYYHSEGVQGTNVGYSYPSFDQVFYTFDVGDAFMLRFEDFEVDWPLAAGLGGSFKFEIIGIDSSDNELKYITDVCGSISHYINDTTEYESFQLENYYYNPDSLFGESFGYPGEISKFTLPCMTDIFPFWSCTSQIGFNDLYSNAKSGYTDDFDFFYYPEFIEELSDSLKLILKGFAVEFGGINEITNLSVLSNVLPDYHVGVKNVFIEEYVFADQYRYQLNFMEGVGLVKILVGGYNKERSVSLIGFRKDGVVYGNVSSCTIVGIPETSKPDININFYPNPFENDLTISNHDNRNYRLEVLDVVGRKILEVQIIQGENNISLKQFQGNAFILRFIADNEVYTKRVFRVNR